jgi:uncharacterized OB-fold protein
MNAPYFSPGLPIPVPDRQGPASPFWQGLVDNRLRIQKCRHCQSWQWGPEYICARCHAFDLDWVDIEPKGRIYSWTRIWQAAQPALAQAAPYLVVLVELDAAPGVRLIGNLIGSGTQGAPIGASVHGVFEHHATEPLYALLQWRLSD